MEAEILSKYNTHQILVHLKSLSKSDEEYINFSQFMRFWHLPHLPAAKAQMHLHKCTVWPEPSILAHTKKGCR